MARPTITDVALSTWAQPFAGEKAKTVTISGPYNAQQSSAATSDTLVVFADYGIYDNTASLNVDANSTNFKDNI